MSIYPGGGTPPTTPTTAIHAVADRVVSHPSVFAFTGIDLIAIGFVAAVCVGVGIVMWGINRAGRDA